VKLVPHIPGRTFKSHAVWSFIYMCILSRWCIKYGTFFM